MDLARFEELIEFRAALRVKRGDLAAHLEATDQELIALERDLAELRETAGQEQAIAAVASDRPDGWVGLSPASSQSGGARDGLADEPPEPLASGRERAAAVTEAVEAMRGTRAVRPEDAHLVEARRRAIAGEAQRKIEADWNSNEAGARSRWGRPE
jgi:hypothetical protein